MVCKGDVTSRTWFPVKRLLWILCSEWTVILINIRREMKEFFWKCVRVCDRWRCSRRYPSSPAAMPSQQGCVCCTALQGSGPAPRSWTTSCSGWDCWPPCAPRRLTPPLEWWLLHHTTQRSALCYSILYCSSHLDLALKLRRNQHVHFPHAFDVTKGQLWLSYRINCCSIAGNVCFNWCFGVHTQVTANFFIITLDSGERAGADEAFWWTSS